MATSEYTADYLATVRRDARPLLREAVAMNIAHRKTGRDSSRFSDERDDVVADLLAAGCPANYADYDHSSDV